MAKIAIVTDSTADISQGLIEAYDIQVVPLTVSIDDKQYLDRVEIQNDTLYRHLEDCDKLPVTSQPTPAQFVEAYRTCMAKGADVVFSVHIAANLSGTFNGAQMAAEMVKDDIEVLVFDSASATGGLGLQVCELARFIKKTPDAAKAEIFLKKMIAHTDVFFILDSLDNLSKGGRIGKASYLVGSLLSIKPTLRLNGGVIEAYDKIRTNKIQKAMKHLLDTSLQHVVKDRPFYIGVAYNNNLPYAQQLAEELKTACNLDDVTLFQLGSVVSIHVGLGALGVVIIQPEGDTTDDSFKQTETSNR